MLFCCNGDRESDDEKRFPGLTASMVVQHGWGWEFYLDNAGLDLCCDYKCPQQG